MVVKDMKSKETTPILFDYRSYKFLRKMWLEIFVDGSRK